MKRAAIAAAVLLAAAFLLIAHVGEGGMALRRLRWAESFTVLEPGFHLRVPLLHEFETLPRETSIEGRAELASREGVAVGVDFAVTVALTASAVKAPAREGMLPEAWLDREARSALARAAAEMPGDAIREGLADTRLVETLGAELSRLGMHPTSVSASAAGTAAAAAPPAPRRTLAHPIVLIGLDGADWQIADPLIAAGKLPHLRKLRDEGAWGHLRSSSPMLSPLLWTTAVTGKPPDKHGIVDFLVRDPVSGKKVPITSSFRRVPALWNMFSGRGLSTAFVAWWATYPAEPVNGEMVSDRVAYSLFDVTSLGGSGVGLVYPPSLWDAVREKRVPPESLGDEEIRRLADVTPEEIAKARREAAGKGSEASKDRLVHLMKILASTRTYHAIALDVISRGQPDLFGVYYQAIDEVSHRTAQCVAPALGFCAPGDAARFGGSIDAAYEYQDELLGELLGAIRKDSYVILLSDHGFRNGGDRPRDVAPDIDGKPAKWHRQYGVAVISGPGIRAGSLDNVTLDDVAPTILRLAGLPLAKDMEGRPLVGPEGAPPAPEAIASYDLDPAAAAAREAMLAQASDDGQEEMLENLRSLGYIGGDSPARAAEDPAGGAGGQAVPGTLTSHGNMGAVHLQNGEFDLARREFEAALKISPSYYPALIGLSDVLIHDGRKKEALELVRRGMEDSRAPEPAVYLRYAALAYDVGAADEAKRTLSRIRGANPGVAELPTALAVLAHKASRYDESERLLNEALAIDPANNEAITRLMWYRRREGNEEALEPALRKALEINPGSVLHRNLLGLILEKRGDFKGAEREFKRALDSAPDFGGTMANLGSLYGRAGRLQEAADLLEKALEIEPRNLECRVNLGAALGKLGRVDEALAVLEAGRSGDKASPELLNALAVAYANKGDVARAESLLRESLRLRPEQPTVKDMLRQLTEAG